MQISDGSVKERYPENIEIILLAEKKKVRNIMKNICKHFVLNNEY